MSTELDPIDTTATANTRTATAPVIVTAALALPASSFREYLGRSSYVEESKPISYSATIGGEFEGPDLISLTDHHGQVSNQFHESPPTAENPKGLI